MKIQELIRSKINLGESRQVVSLQDLLNLDLLVTEDIHTGQIKVLYGNVFICNAEKLPCPSDQQEEYYEQFPDYQIWLEKGIENGKA